MLEDKDRTEKSNNNGVLINRKDLTEISELAESLLPKSVINCVNRSAAVAPPSLLLTAGRRLREYQLVALDWLQTMYRENLPAVLADEQGLGRRVVTAAFISNLVCEVGAPGPHLILSPASSLHRWQQVLTAWCRAAGGRSHRSPPRLPAVGRRAVGGGRGAPPFANQLLCLPKAPGLVHPPTMGPAVLAEVQNVAAAASFDQIAALCALRTDRKMLILSGPHKENPIDLWNIVYLLFPITSGLVEGTGEYTDTVHKLQKLSKKFAAVSLLIYMLKLSYLV